MQCLLKKLLSRFVKPSVIEEHKDCLTEVVYADPANHLHTSKIFIGLTTASQIRKGLDDGDITEHLVKKFHSSVIAFYTSAVAYILQWFPFHDAIVKDSEFVDFNKKEQCDFSMVCTFIDQYSKLLPFNSIELDKVCEEFLDYQSMSKDEIPKDVWDEAICDEQDDGCNKVTYHRMDRIWSYLGEMKLPGMNTARLLRIAKVANVIFTIPHSNAGEERVFSVIHKIRRDDRGSLQLQGTLSSLVTVKLNLPETKAHPCYAFEPSNALIQKARKATSFYNKEVCSSKHITVPHP